MNQESLLSPKLYYHLYIAALRDLSLTLSDLYEFIQNT